MNDDAVENRHPTAVPLTLSRPGGLSVELLSHGALKRLLTPQGLMLNLFVGNELEGGPANIWLRRRDAGGAVQLAPLLGPASPLGASFGPDGLLHMQGRWQDLALTLQLRLVAGQATAFWHLQLHNLGRETCSVNPLLVQDLGLADYATIRLNEYYISHYLDLQPLQHKQHGVLLAARQNQAQQGQHPWLLAASLRRCVRYATDAAQLYGSSARAGLPPTALLNGLPAQRLQQEHALLALEDEDLLLPPGARARAGFVLHLEPHHPAASSAADLARLAPLLALPEARPLAEALPASQAMAAAPSLFVSAPSLACRDLTEPELAALAPGGWRHAERDDQGRLLSFFHGEASHLVLRAKELLVQRPHGHLLRSGAHLMPDERALTSTCWMGGVFHSMLTQGHVSFNRLLSAQRGLLGLFRSQGLRLFVRGRQQGAWQLLGLPSAFEMQPQGCRWLYAHAGGLIEVCSQAGVQPEEMALQLRVQAGAPLELRASLHLALDGDDGSLASPARPVVQRDGAQQRLRIGPPEGSELARRFPQGAFWIEATGGTELLQWGDDALLYPDGLSRGEPLLCLDFAAATALNLRLRGALLPGAADVAQAPPLSLPRWSAAVAPLAGLGEILPWYLHNALVHYLAPRGLEQFSGGGWGTRDVCQGPLELLLALGQPAPVRDLLCRVFAAQNADGDWPQWFMFFERERAVRAGDSHGDIVFWPLLGLAQYLIASGDAALLAQPLPFHDEPPAPLWAHVERALALIRRRCVPGTGLAAYWHGDWNDSLQPADPQLRERLCSAWTVTLHHQMLDTLAQALESLGRAELAPRLREEAAAVLDEFRRWLLRDGVVAGYLHLDESGRAQLWLHPADTRTGLRYSLLPMMHAVLADMLSPDEARAQAALIQAHLSGPDGARLFDAPLPYRGGLQHLFQRAETSSFFGREIGVMYMHAHLRHAQMLAHLGQAEALLRALALAHPVGLPERVASASRRQANCYYSSSDAAFADRYEAQAHYGRVLTGQVALDGGWRVYSSGPGIALGLVITHLLGLRLTHQALLLDPVLPPALDGLEVQLNLGELRFELRYRVRSAQGHGVVRVTDLDAGPAELAFERRAHPYRLGPAALPRPRPQSGALLRWEIEIG